MAKTGKTLAKKVNQTGHDVSTRKARTSLAARVRELTNQGELVVDFYLKVLEGKNPKLIRDEDGNPAEIGEEAHGTPTLDQKMLAAARILERGYGQPAQHTHIEAEVRAEVTAIAGGVDPRYFGKLSPEALLAIRNAVKALPAREEETGDDEAIDAEYVEVEK